MKTKNFKTASLNRKNSTIAASDCKIQSCNSERGNNNMRNVFFLFMTLFLSLPLLSAGQNIIETRDVGSFTAIDASGVFNVFLTQGDETLVEIETREDIMDQVKTSVKGGTLVLSTQGNVRNAKIIARVTSPVIEQIKLSGASSLVGQNEIQSSELKINVSGASKLEMALNAGSLETRGSGAVNIALSGWAEYHNIVMSGASQLRARDLETNTTMINISGASNARVWAKEMLDVKGSGTSRVSYEADPNSRRVSLSGTASVNEITAQNVSTLEESGDTVKVRVGRRDLWVIDDKGDRSSKRKARRSFKSNWSGFELGINGFLTPDNKLDLGPENEHLDLRYPKSVVVNLNLFQQNLPLIGSNLGLVTGVGLGFNNYRFDNQYIFIPDRDGLIPVLEEDRTMRKNKFTVTYVNVPLLLEFQTQGRRSVERFHMAGGMIVGTRIGTHAKYVFDDNGRKKKEKTYNDYNMQPFRFDLTGRIGWSKLNLFATYSLNSLFKENRGPELYPFSVGVQLTSF
jgi:hypothetical protein